MSYSVTPDRTAALERMTQALEAAKKARDSGVDVHQGREFLKRSRAAFEAGNYPLAKQLADQVLEIYGKTAAVVRLARDGPRYSPAWPRPSTL